MKDEQLVELIAKFAEERHWLSTADYNGTPAQKQSSLNDLGAAGIALLTAMLRRAPTADELKKACYL